MKHVLFAIFLVIELAVTAHAAEPHFIDSSAVDAVALLPPPPLPGSAAATADMDAVLKAQITRTDFEVERGKSEATLSPSAFQSVLGADFTPQKYPHIYALLEDAAQDSKPFSTRAKQVFSRPRPKFADSHVRPTVDGDDEPTYPSGHATRAMLWARILSEIAPEKKHALLQRGAEIGWDRVLIGVHYPSDVFAGEVLGQALAQAMSKNADFQARLAEAKEEFHATGPPQPVAAALQ